MLELITHLLRTNVGVLLATLIGIFIAMLPILKDWAESHWKKRFREQLRKAIANENLAPEDLLHLAERWAQDRRSVLFSLRAILAASISGEEETLKDKCSQIRELITWHTEREPFAELPENIGLQLNAMKIQFPDSKTNIGQLAASLNDLYAINKADLKKQKLYGFWGFLVGIFGLLLSIGSLYLAFSAKG